MCYCNFWWITWAVGVCLFCATGSWLDVNSIKIYISVAAGDGDGDGCDSSVLIVIVTLSAGDAEALTFNGLDIIDLCYEKGWNKWFVRWNWFYLLCDNVKTYDKYT